MASSGAANSEAIGKLPYAGKENEVVVMSSYSDMNKLFLCWAFENDEQRFAKKSLNYINSLI